MRRPCSSSAGWRPSSASERSWSRCCPVAVRPRRSSSWSVSCCSRSGSSPAPARRASSAESGRGVSTAGRRRSSCSPRVSRSRCWRSSSSACRWRSSGWPSTVPPESWRRSSPRRSSTSALVRLLVVDTRALTWAQMGIRRFDGRALSDLVGGALWALPVIVATLPVVAILGALLPVQPVSPLPPAGETLGFALNLLAGAVVAPIGEEILFRGFATTAWAQDLGSAASARSGSPVLRGRTRPDDQRRRCRRGPRPGGPRRSRPRAGGARPRLAVPAPRLDLGAHRPACRVQRDPAGAR